VTALASHARSRAGVHDVRPGELVEGRLDRSSRRRVDLEILVHPTAAVPPGGAGDPAGLVLVESRLETRHARARGRERSRGRGVAFLGRSTPDVELVGGRAVGPAFGRGAIEGGARGRSGVASSCVRVVQLGAVPVRGSHRRLLGLQPAGRLGQPTAGGLRLGLPGRLRAPERRRLLAARPAGGSERGQLRGGFGEEALGIADRGLQVDSSRRERRGEAPPLGGQGRDRGIALAD
jgi:hypothetical protein